jgi:hypothetical protein
MRDLSQKHLDMVGQVLSYTSDSRGKVEGTCTAVERTPGYVQTPDGDFLGLRLKLKPVDGGRAFWTGTFADYDSPLGEARS